MNSSVVKKSTSKITFVNNNSIDNKMIISMNLPLNSRHKIYNAKWTKPTKVKYLQSNRKDRQVDQKI